MNPAAKEATMMFIVKSKIPKPPRKKNNDDIITKGSQSTIVLRCQSYRLSILICLNAKVWRAEILPVLGHEYSLNHCLIMMAKRIAVRLRIRLVNQKTLMTI